MLYGQAERKYCIFKKDNCMTDACMFWEEEEYQICPKTQQPSFYCGCGCTHDDAVIVNGGSCLIREYLLNELRKG